MDVKIEIPAARIADIMITAIEGNHMVRSWCRGIFLEKPHAGDNYPRYKTEHGESSIWYADPALYEEGGFVMKLEEISDERTGKITRHTLRPSDFAKGLHIMATKHPKHFGDFMAENEDIFTADVFLQCVALQEVIYG